MARAWGKKAYLTLKTVVRVDCFHTWLAGRGPVPACKGLLSTHRKPPRQGREDGQQSPRPVLSLVLVKREGGSPPATSLLTEA